MNSEKIKQANGRLKVAGIRIQIQAIGNSLYLVGTLVYRVGLAALLGSPDADVRTTLRTSSQADGAFNGSA